MCTDLFNSNAKPEGDVLGRVDAICGRSEVQKFVDSLHIYFQIFVQYLHYHVPLYTLLLQHRTELRRFFENYTKFKISVYKHTYEDLSGSIEILTDKN